jgi:hypothetical protein
MSQFFLKILSTTGPDQTTKIVTMEGGLGMSLYGHKEVSSYHLLDARKSTIVT